MAPTELQSGQRAPHSGSYEQLNVLGTRTGAITHANEGEKLPETPRGFSWRPLTLRPAAELRREAEEYRRLALSATTMPVMATLCEIADRFDALADQSRQSEMPGQSPSMADALVNEINRTASKQACPLDTVIAATRLAIAACTDPYLLVENLIEGACATIARHVPPERQGEVSVEAVRLMRDRLRAHNAI